VLGAEKASKNSGRSGKGDHQSRWKRLAWVNVLRTSIDQGFLKGNRFTNTIFSIGLDVNLSVVAYRLLHERLFRLA
jgi:hypothetical protein